MYPANKLSLYIKAHYPVVFGYELSDKGLPASPEISCVLSSPGDGTAQIDFWAMGLGERPTPEEVSTWEPPTLDSDAAPAKPKEILLGEVKELRAQIAEARTATADARSIAALSVAVDAGLATLDAVLAKLAGE